MQTESDLITKQDAEEFFAFAYAALKAANPGIRFFEYEGALSLRTAPAQKYFDLRWECYGKEFRGVQPGNPLHVDTFAHWLRKKNLS
jgi:hypothetical protein